MKIGIDIHGVADKYRRFFVELSRLFVEAGHEVHIVTGRRQKEMESEVKEIGLKWTHFFSICDYHEARGTEISYGPRNNPWMDEKLWRETKAAYAERVGLDMMFDDSDNFWRYFKTPYARIMPELVKAPEPPTETFPVPMDQLRDLLEIGDEGDPTKTVRKWIETILQKRGRE